MPDYGTRDFYLHLAQQDAEPEPLPLDAPDWDWPDAPHPNDAPDPRVNDQHARHFAWGWRALTTIITLGSLAYLYTQVSW